MKLRRVSLFCGIWRHRLNAKSLRPKSPPPSVRRHDSVSCPYLGNEVEFTDERIAHVTERHPDLLPAHLDLIGKTLLDPDSVRISAKMTTARELSRWYADLLS